MSTLSRTSSRRGSCSPERWSRPTRRRPSAPTSPENAPSGIPENEIAEALLAHVEIEPGQGIDDLALAMGTPAADLQEPIKKLLEENKITEELRQGQASYYPT